MSEQVVMEHPGLGPERRQTVPLKQFDSSWKRAGWFLVEAEVLEAEAKAAEAAAAKAAKQAKTDSQKLETAGYAEEKKSTTQKKE
jgi:hypothetical protein